MRRTTGYQTATLSTPCRSKIGKRRGFGANAGHVVALPGIGCALQRGWRPISKLGFRWPKPEKSIRYPDRYPDT